MSKGKAVMIIKEIETKSIFTKSNLPVSDYSVNPYVGCSHACKYCYASFMKRFTNHPEPWGEFLDVKYWQDIKNPGKYCGKELFFGSVTDPYNPQEIEHRLAAMKQLHDAGIRTTCFIWPIFPGITDVPAIIDRVKKQCNLVWLENLNLRGSYKMVILDYIREKHPDLITLYDEIYSNGSRLYWEALDGAIRSYANSNGLEYVRNDDSRNKPFDAQPTIVNFFYHEKIKKSARKAGKALPSEKHST
ncbi:radical SAM protein [[Clostridium] symbiosum]|uniref:radical SAM protein n=1 Tax=Clostridium symbiosum TaxID=1512 RepID=UPI003B509000